MPSSRPDSAPPDSAAPRAAGPRAAGPRAAGPARPRSVRRRDLLTVHLPAAAWLALVTLALAVPAGTADLPEWVPRFLHFQALDKVIHGLLFTGTGFLLTRSFRRLPLPRPAALAFLAAAAYGAATELGQHLFTDRAGELADAGADVLGAAVGVLLAVALLRAGPP